MTSTTTPHEADPSVGVLVHHQPEANRWLATLGAVEIGALTYQFAGGRYVLVSTHVDSAYRHRGVASLLARTAMDEIRASGKKLTVICPFVGDVIARHPEYFDLVDPVHPGVGVTGSQGNQRTGDAAAHREPVTSPVSENAQLLRTMVLGMVAFNGPVSAAQLVQDLRTGDVHRWAALSESSVEAELAALSEEGLIRRHDGEGHAPAGFVCTEGGRAELHHLLLGMLHTDAVQPFDLAPLLHFVTALTVDELGDGLRRRILNIDEVIAHESSVIAHAPADGPARESEIARLNLAQYAADRTWSLGFIGRLYGGGTSAA